MIVFQSPNHQSESNLQYLQQLAQPVLRYRCLVYLVYQRRQQRNTVLKISVAKTFEMLDHFVWLHILEVPYYTVFHQFHTAVRGSTTLYLKCIAPKPIRGPEFQLSKSRSSELYWDQAVSVPAPLNVNELRLSAPALPATRPSQGEDAIYTSGSMC